MSPFPSTTARAPSAWPLALAVLAFAVAATARIAWFGVEGRSPDEHLWTQFGAGIARSGPAYLTRLAHDFNRDADVEYPWPQRAGYSCLVALAMRVSADTTVHATEGLSTAASLANVAATGAVAWTALGPWLAAPAMLFLAASPLDLALARRGWQDDVTALLTTLMLAAALAHLGRGRGRSRAAFLALAAFGLTVKESMVIPYGLGVLALAAAAWARARRPADAVRALAWGALPALAAGAAIVAVAGGPAELRHLLVLAREANAPDEYMRHYQSGGPEYYVTGLRLLQPVPFALGALAAVVALVRPRALAAGLPREHAGRALFAIAVLVGGFGAVSFAYFSKNMRFLSPLYGPVALLAAASVARAATLARERLPRPAALAVAALLALTLAGSAALDLRRFEHWFVELEMQDLATPWFTEAIARGDG